MVTLGVLAVLCIGALIPQALRSRAERHQQFLDSIRHAALGETITQPLSLPQAGRPPPPRFRRSPIPQRRTLFVVLLASVVLSAASALASPGKVSLVVFLAVVDCFLAYVAQLVRWRDARSPATVDPSRAPVPDLVVTPAAVHPALRAG